MKSLLPSSSSSSSSLRCRRSVAESFSAASWRARRSPSSRRVSSSFLSRRASASCWSRELWRSLSRLSAASRASRSLRSLLASCSVSPCSCAELPPWSPAGAASGDGDRASPPDSRSFRLCALSRASCVICSRISSSRRSASARATFASSSSRPRSVICSRAMELMLAMDWLCRSSRAIHRCWSVSNAPAPSDGSRKSWASPSSAGKTSSTNCWKTLRSSLTASKVLRHACSRRSRASRFTGVSCAAASSKTPSLSGRRSLQKRWNEVRSSIRSLLKRTTLTYLSSSLSSLAMALLASLSLRFSSATSVSRGMFSTAARSRSTLAPAPDPPPEPPAAILALARQCAVHLGS
mmetsp:Transcript_108463/g.307543  ORF Transcript_108463/g.307543 Transcript_108463/m.307543 type:complete len:351 (+) Transcript_108463:590-1642(+)